MEDRRRAWNPFNGIERTSGITAFLMMSSSMRIHSMELKGTSCRRWLKISLTLIRIHSMELKGLVVELLVFGYDLVRRNPFNGIESLFNLTDGRGGAKGIHSMELKEPGCRTLSGRPSASRIHSMELKETGYAARLRSIAESLNPFNGIESQHAVLALTDIVRPSGIHSMELKDGLHMEGSSESSS